MVVASFVTKVWYPKPEFPSSQNNSPRAANQSVLIQESNIDRRLLYITLNMGGK